MNFINDFKSPKASSNELSMGKKRAEKPKLKPRFSVNLTDSDFERVSAHCERIGSTHAALARTLLLRELERVEKME